MSTVISIRIPKELKQLMDKVNVDWQTEIREYIKRRIREELLKYYLESSKPYLEQMKTIDNVELIREDREENS
ncbi:MAG: VapB-type antitoxin [Candidatus Aramenus sp.]|nr:VapB-type antitoxin [Candidatus Aramenus sp.]